MAYNLADLIYKVRRRAKDTSFDYELITDYLQETQNQILERSRFPFMEASDDDTASSGTITHSLTSDAETILSLHLIDGTNVLKPQYLGYPEFYERFDPEVALAASPCFYTTFGSSVVWQAPLDRTYTVRARYLKQPSTLATDTDVPDIPERFKEILIRGALAHVEEYRDNYDIAALHARKVEELTEDMLNRLSLRQLATSHKARFGRR